MARLARKVLARVLRGVRSLSTHLTNTNGDRIYAGSRRLGVGE